jgi:hypothetical protein
MKPIDIVALVIMAIGFAVVISSRAIVKKFNLVENQVCKYADQMSEEELENYKLNKAMYHIKIMGLVITIPGLFLLLVSSKL